MEARPTPRIVKAAAAVALALLPSAAVAQGARPLTKCAPDAVVSGTVCMDRYEASVWRVPDPLGANRGLVKKIRQGKAKAADLAKGGATQLGLFGPAGTDDYAPCADSGQNCLDDIYALSLPDLTPSAGHTWFQAHAACENAGKRLPSNTEWQAAVTGTPDPGPDDGATTCDTADVLSPSGSRAACVSTRGAFDMVGNLWEWVADWVPGTTGCLDNVWSAAVSPTGDSQCFVGASASGGDPGVLIRGGGVNHGALGGPLAVLVVHPSNGFDDVGFRCTR